jgi:hypothetical protein
MTIGLKRSSLRRNAREKKEGGKMKKIVCLVAIVLLIGSVVFAAQKAAKISEKNLASLQGSWEGMMSFGEAIGGASNAPVKLEILSGTVPVKGKLTIQNVPDAVARALGIMGGTTNVVENNDGVISSQGALVWSGENKSFLKVTLSGEKKMRGTYYFRGIEGDMNLEKK